MKKWERKNIRRIEYLNERKYCCFLSRVFGKRDRKVRK